MEKPIDWRKKFQMDPGEIVTEYRTAANRQKQITILADHNNCSERDIAELLQERGEPLPKKHLDMLDKPRRESQKVKRRRLAAIQADIDAGRVATTSPVTISSTERASLTPCDLFEAIAPTLPEPAPVPAPPSWTIDQLKIIAFDVLGDVLLQRDEYATAFKVLAALFEKLEKAR